MVIVHTVRIGVIGVGTLRDVLMVLPLLVAVGSHPLNQVEGAAALLIHRAKVLDRRILVSAMRFLCREK